MVTSAPAKPQPPMEGFPTDGNPWRIDWIGGISYDPDDEPRLRFYLSRLIQNTPVQKALLNGSLFKDELERYQYTYFDAKVGFIQFLKIGSVWINGFRQFEYRGEVERFQIALGDTELISLAKTGSISGQGGEWEQILGNYQYRITDDTARGGSWVVLVRDHPRYDKIIIPSSVIFQRCYVTSPKAASKIIYGQIDKLIDLKDSGPIEGEPNVFRINIHRDYKSTEGPMLMNLVADPAGKVNLARLRRNLVKSQSEYNKLTNLCVNFPFSNLIDMEVIGRKIAYKDSNTGKEEKGFLVTEIQALHTDFQFDKYVIVRKNSGVKGQNQADELIDAYGGASARQVANADATDVAMTNNDVSSYLEPTQVMETIGIFPNRMEEIEAVKELQKYKNKGFSSIADDIEDGGGISTGPSRVIKKGEHELDVELAPPARLDDFFDLLKLINKANLNLNFTTIAVCNSVQSDKGVVNYFNKTIAGLRSWHYTENKKQPRGFVVARCEYAGVHHYLIDVEAKGTSALSIAYITQNSGVEITIKELSLLMTRFAREHGWSVLEKGGYAKSWKIELHDHVRKADLLGVLAQRIIKRMSK